VFVAVMVVVRRWRRRWDRVELPSPVLSPVDRVFGCEGEDW